jgi:hypothetical protein
VRKRRATSATRTGGLRFIIITTVLDGSASQSQVDVPAKREEGKRKVRTVLYSALYSIIPIFYTVRWKSRHSIRHTVTK